MGLRPEVNRDTARDVLNATAQEFAKGYVYGHNHTFKVAYLALSRVAERLGLGIMSHDQVVLSVLGDRRATDHRITVRLPDDYHALLQGLAEELGIPPAVLARKAVMEKLGYREPLPLMQARSRDLQAEPEDEDDDDDDLADYNDDYPFT